MVKNKNCMSRTPWDKDELNPEFLLATRPLVITRFEPAGSLWTVYIVHNFQAFFFSFYKKNPLRYFSNIEIKRNISKTLKTKKKNMLRGLDP